MDLHHTWAKFYRFRRREIRVVPPYDGGTLTYDNIGAVGRVSPKTNFGYVIFKSSRAIRATNCRTATILMISPQGFLDLNRHQLALRYICTLIVQFPQFCRCAFER